MLRSLSAPDQIMSFQMTCAMLSASLALLCFLEGGRVNGIMNTFTCKITYMNSQETGIGNLVSRTAIGPPALIRGESLSRLAQVHVDIDGFAKSPSAALRFIFRHCSVLLCTPHSPRFARLVPPVAGELFTVPSSLATFYEVINIVSPKNLCYAATCLEGTAPGVLLSGPFRRSLAMIVRGSLRAERDPLEPSERRTP